MKVVMLMFDTLRRNKLPPYNPDAHPLPNFQRLGEKTVRFDNFYVGSMPCMPARRDLHTGRLNFLHRSWGPLEPFDDSIFEIMKKHGIYSHLITDHQHYWEDGGATYHNRYNSYEFIRGQEGDLWKAKIGFTGAEKLDAWKNAEPLRRNMIEHDQINRSYMHEERDYPQARCYQAGLEFLAENHRQDNWFLQIESFDPHEPFFVPDRFKRMVDPALVGNTDDWPEYSSTERINNPQKVIDGEKHYQALMLMCDEYLGKVLDFFDTHDMWQDTMLIINTDHGFMFGEKEWSGKSVMPVYNEIAHTPFFIWDPRSQVAGESRDELAQMHDVAVTLLDAFGIEKTPQMTGQSLLPMLTKPGPVKSVALFGYFGAHVSITDGRYVYMRGSQSPENIPLYEYTLMPTRMRRMFNATELRNATLHPGFPFTGHIPVMKIPGSAGFYSSYAHGNLLFDLQLDKNQEHPLCCPEREAAMMRMLSLALSEAQAPEDEWRRLGLPVNIDDIHAGYVSQEHARRNQVMQQYLGPLNGMSMHPDTRTLLLEIAACPGGETFLSELAASHSLGHLKKQTVIAFYEQGNYARELYSLFNKPY
ncbi:Choline-sulfatase [Edwardsiella anguillarum]|uniref:sulfatase n=1 Tax=Edwardsiella TaxID=635 RepID=UPI00045C9164|nr:sulfatase [Edwardsiella anguillarum]AKM48622.1 sulfatase [Edwardsiella sp. EA181011]GAJ67898.1 choline-sulfatase [Edwardsiella piscicida]RFS99764.1 sulfatase [Edwardsiella anguillarum]WHP81057.1 sulfatase [Edwardsiella anguillarum]WHQ13301.1 sulfatase [Edwardsiella anguillarum]